MYSVGGIGGLVGGRGCVDGSWCGSTQLMLVGGVVYAASLFVVAHGAVLGVTLPALVGISFAFVAISTSMTTLLQTDTDPALRAGCSVSTRRSSPDCNHSAPWLMASCPAPSSSTRSGWERSWSARHRDVVVTPSFRARVSGRSTGRIAGPAAAPDTLA